MTVPFNVFVVPPSVILAFHVPETVSFNCADATMLSLPSKKKSVYFALASLLESFPAGCLVPTAVGVAAGVTSEVVSVGVSAGVVSVGVSAADGSVTVPVERSASAASIYWYKMGLTAVGVVSYDHPLWRVPPGLRTIT